MASLWVVQTHQIQPKTGDQELILFILKQKISQSKCFLSALLTTSMICWSVTPKVNTRGEDSLSTGRFCLGSDGSGRYQNNMRGSMFDNIKSSLDDNIPKCTSHSRWAGPSTAPSHTGLPGSLRKGKEILKFVLFFQFFFLCSRRAQKMNYVLYWCWKCCREGISYWCFSL